MKLIIRYVFRYKQYVLLSLMGVLGFILIQMGLPTILKYVLNDALPPNGDKDLLIKLVMLMLIALLLGFLGEICMAFANSRICTNVIRDIRNDLFKKTQSFSHKEFDEFSASSLITSATSDSYQIMIFTQMCLRTVLITPLMAISGFVLIIETNPSMMWFVLGIIPALFVIVFVISARSKKYSEGQQTTLDRINLTLREGLMGLRVIRAFQNEQFQNERFEDVNAQYAMYSRKVFRLTALSAPLFYLLFSCMLAVVIWVSSKQIQVSHMDVGTLAATIEYVFHIMFSFMMLGILFIMYPRAAVSANRIQRVLDKEASISINEDGIKQTNKKGYVRFENVTFAYGGSSEEPVIKNVSFEAKPGEVVAFIGSTGSGKSTLLQLIPRIYEASKGRILIDDVDVCDFNIHSLREKVGFIPQKAVLFSGTIADNFRVGKKDATLEEMKYAAKIAQASDFIEAKELQYEEVLSEAGSNLSGGQKQRLAIARAIVKKPEIYVFDDSFSALDAITDHALRNALKQEIKDATILIVAQRIGTIMHADKIVVLNEGKVVGEGTHQELLKKCPIYYDIAASQMAEEELS
ncbi:MAG: ABC transporter ATP-binding protein [Breznakia sp.]